MKFRVDTPLFSSRQWRPHSLPRLSRTGLTLAGAVCALTLSGCYYPYGYYPGYYPGYYATVPATSAQQEAPAGPGDPYAQQQQPPQSAQQAQANSQSAPPAYPPPPPPVYAAPAYYPPPYYPAYPAYYGYGYPGWYGPSVSIGFGYWCCGHGGWHGYHH